MKLSTIQIGEDTKKKLDNSKIHPGESYDSVLKRILDLDSIPSMEEMFIVSKNIKQDRIYSTKEVIELSHSHRSKK